MLEFGSEGYMWYLLILSRVSWNWVICDSQTSNSRDILSEHLLKFHININFDVKTVYTCKHGEMYQLWIDLNNIKSSVNHQISRMRFYSQCPEFQWYMSWFIQWYRSHAQPGGFIPCPLVLKWLLTSTELVLWILTDYKLYWYPRLPSPTSD